MISLEKWKILTHLQKLLNNEGYLGKIIVATGFKKLPKVQQIAKSGHTEEKQASNQQWRAYLKCQVKFVSRFKNSKLFETITNLSEILFR